MYAKECLKCDENLSDPVCIRCYLKEFVIWLNEQEFSLEKRSFLMSLIKKNLMSDIVVGYSCILCEKKEVCICRYCFFTNINNYLIIVDVSNDKLARYKLDFNCEVTLLRYM